MKNDIKALGVQKRRVKESVGVDKFTKADRSRLSRPLRK